MTRYSQVHLKMTPQRKRRLKVMADIMGMPMSTFIKMILDDKWIQMTDNMTIKSYKELDCPNDTHKCA